MKTRWMPLAVPALALAATAALAQNPYSQPWSEVSRGDPSQVRKEAPVAITKIDGKSTRNPRKSDALAPGKHMITIHYDTARGVVNDEYRDIEMDLEGCTRYRIVAQVNGPPVTEWKPHVYSEPIGECAAKFKKKDAPKK